jgi:hypothetical protein
MSRRPAKDACEPASMFTIGALKITGRFQPTVLAIRDSVILFAMTMISIIASGTT